MSQTKASKKTSIIKPTKFVQAEEKRVASMMPVPVGYQLLLAIPKADEKTEGGVIKTGNLIEQETTATMVGFVLAMGPMAYKDPKRFPDGVAWCKPEDWVVFSPFVGTRFEVADQEVRLLSDDCILAVVEDPRGIKRK